MLQQPALELALRHLGAERQEVEAVGVLHQLLGQVGLRRRQGPGEVGERLALAAVQAALDLVDEDAAAPAVLDGLPRVPQPLGRVLDGVQEPHVVAPGQLCSNPLHDLAVGVGLGEGAHVFEVSGRQAGHLREVAPQVGREPVDDAGAPALGGLPGEDVAADAPVELDQLSVDSDGGAQPGRPDPLLQLGQQRDVYVPLRGGSRQRGHGREPSNSGPGKLQRSPPLRLRSISTTPAVARSL